MNGRHKMRILQTLILAVPAALFAQPPAIRSVVNFASQDARFSPGMPAELRYSASDYFKVESDKVLVGGKPVAVHDEEDGESLIVFLPADLPLGPAAVVLQTNTGNSQPFQIVVDASSPGSSLLVHRQTLRGGRSLRATIPRRAATYCTYSPSGSEHPMPRARWPNLRSRSEGKRSISSSLFRG